VIPSYRRRSGAFALLTAPMLVPSAAKPSFIVDWDNLVVIPRDPRSTAGPLMDGFAQHNPFNARAGAKSSILNAAHADDGIGLHRCQRQSLELVEQFPERRQGYAAPRSGVDLFRRT
jgi:hypothetical protein